MDEYVIMNKSDLVSMADTIRDILGSTDGIAVTDLGTKLIESIEAGGGGVITATFTVAADTTSKNLDYSPQSVEEWPSWLIIIAEKDTTTEHSSFNGVWATHIVYSNVQQKHSSFSYSCSCAMYGYNKGTYRYYTPAVKSEEVLSTKYISCNPSCLNTPFLAGVTYRYYMGFG